jgi:hypothetical protein
MRILGVIVSSMLLLSALVLGALLLVDDGSDEGSEPRERTIETDAATLDSDDDGLSDRREKAVGSDPFEADSDGDRLNDKRELELGLDPTDSDTDGDGVMDSEDPIYHQLEVQTHIPTEKHNATLHTVATPEEFYFMQLEFFSPSNDGPQLWHTIALSLTPREVGNPRSVPARLAIDMHESTVKTHPNVTVYAFRAGHNWTRNWTAIPTHYNESNGTLDANLSAVTLTEYEWLVVSDNKSLHNASIKQGKVHESRIMSFDGPDPEWSTTEDTRFNNGSIELISTDQMAEARRTLGISDDADENLTGRNLTGRYRTFGNATLTVTIATERRSVTHNYSSTRWRRFKANTTGLDIGRATVHLATDGRARIDWLRVTRDRDGDGFDDATERIGRSILAPYCAKGASFRPFRWAPLGLNASRNDTDGDGLSDAREVHLETTVNDTNRTLTVRLDDFYSHPDRRATWQSADGSKEYIYCG